MISRFLFPFEMVSAKSKIVLYGSGECGQAYYKQIKATCYCEIIIWLDQNADEVQQNLGAPVFFPEKLKEVTYDFIVIAISNENVANDAAQDLCEKYGAAKEKIITKVIDMELHGAFKAWGEYAYVGNERSRELELIPPRELVSYNRLDITVRWLLCRDFLHGIKNDAHLSLYTRMQLARIQGFVEADYWTDNPKANVEEMLAECKKLCLSIGENGFYKERSVSLSTKNNAVIDGSHRIAASLAAEKNIWVKYYGNVYGGKNFGFDWFEENGFNNDDLVRILRGYCEISPKPLGIAVLYGPVIDQWSYIQSHLKQYFTEVGSVNFDYSGNFYAFETLIREMYYDPSYKNPYNDYKLMFLEKAPLRIKVVLLENDEGTKSEIPFYARLKKIKMQLRDSLFFETAEAPCILHTSDDRQEFNHLKKLLLSVNNQYYLERRIVSNYSDVLLDRLARAKEALNKLGIPIDDCAIAGSSVLEILGLASARDLDIIVHPRHQNKISGEMQEIEEKIEIFAANRIRGGLGDNRILNNIIIEDDNIHFIFYGWKVINIEVYKEAISCCINVPYLAHLKEQCERRLRRIELFEQFSLNFNEKAALREQIQKEYFRKRFN